VRARSGRGGVDDGLKTWRNGERVGGWRDKKGEGNARKAVRGFLVLGWIGAAVTEALEKRIENRVASSKGRTPPASRLLLQPRLETLDEEARTP
jgi:hypothetical protein